MSVWNAVEHDDAQHTAQIATCDADRVPLAIHERRRQVLAESHRLRDEARADGPPPLPRRTGWVIPVTCTCGSTHLEHLTGSEPDAIGARVTAIARCTDCGREWQITALLTPVGERGRGKAA